MKPRLLPLLRLGRKLVVLVIVMSMTLSLVPSASGAPLLASGSNTTPLEIDQAVKDSVIVLPASTVSAVVVTIKFEKISSDPFAVPPYCIPLGGGGHYPDQPFNEELSFRLESPAGTSVDLVFDDGSVATYPSSATYAGVVTVVFDDTAPTQVGSPAPVSGTFRPEEALSAFNGESGKGAWILKAEDNAGGDPLCLYEWSLDIGASGKPKGGFITPTDRDLTRCKLTYIDPKIYIGSDNFFTARGLGKPVTLRFMQKGVLAGFLHIGDYGFEDGKWKVVSNLQDANGLPLFEPGAYQVVCFGPNGTAGSPLRTTIIR